MARRDVLAIDFGTANSYYCKCPGDQLSPQGVDFGDGRDGLATAILYRKGKAPLIGHVAAEEYGEATEAERRDYTLRTHFKPDIASGEQARACAVDFLAAVLDQARRDKVDLDPTRKQVIFGVPSEAGDEYRKALTGIARAAGYGDVTTADEPKGALLYHVFHKDMPAKDALKGLLVVDFGGGTCDFAFLRRGSVRHSWGDMHLGGRLFDDLFFQWFIEANGAAASVIESEGSEYFVHSFLCRETKEFFSRTMARDRSETVTKAIRHYGRIEGMTWESFLARARAYAPSATLVKFVSDVGGALGPRINGGDRRVDLLAWFRRCLADGLREASIDATDIRFVILTGGSSQWPFVSDILAEELGVDAARIMRSDRPYTAIAEGLAIHPALRERFKTTRQKLRDELPAFCSKTLNPLIARRSAAVAGEIAAAITHGLFDEKLNGVLEHFRDAGGDVAGLKTTLAGAAAAYGPKLAALIEDKMAALAAGLPTEVADLVDGWFGEHGLAPPPERVEVERIEFGDLAHGPDVPDFYRGVIGAVAGVTTVIVTSIAAMICGGSGMALITTGPVGLVVGAILGLAITALALTYGVVEARRRAESWPVPRWVLKRMLTDKKIAKARATLRADVELTVTGQLEDLQGPLAAQVRRQVEQEIEALSEINEL